MGQQQTFQWKKLELGTCYYPEHWDKSLWEQDLERMLEDVYKRQMTRVCGVCCGACGAR